MVLDRFDDPRPSVYRLLTAERGWPPERYEKWMADLLCSQLLSDEAIA